MMMSGTAMPQRPDTSVSRMATSASGGSPCASAATRHSLSTRGTFSLPCSWNDDTEKAYDSSGASSAGTAGAGAVRRICQRVIGAAAVVSGGAFDKGIEDFLGSGFLEGDLELVTFDRSD